MDFPDLEVINLAQKKILDTKVNIKVIESRITSLAAEKDAAEKFVSDTRTKLTYMHVAKKILQEIVEKVSQDNLAKVEGFVNRALTLIFTDLDLSFKIEQDVKRGNNVYSFAIYQGKVKGSIHSFGGGVVAVIAVVLKILFNIITKRFPLIVLDETLSFLAVNYIPAMSEFMKTLSKEFDIPILMVTHQPQFASAADTNYEIGIKDGNTVLL